MLGVLPIIMDKKEARKIIGTELEQFRDKPYSELVQMISSEPITFDRVSQTGKMYQIEIQAFWDDKPNGNIRVSGSIDGGGLRSFTPITEDFIKNPENEFIGE